MIKNKKLQLRISEELLESCQQNTENVSLFIREAIRDKLQSGKELDSSLEFMEIRAQTPYTFFATLDRIIDGDTIIANIDLGFFINISVKIRLAGINTPPIETKKGMEAKDYIEKELTGTQLVIETRKKEKYGRYLSYIYYHKDYEEYEDIIRYGKLINDELLKTGLAKNY